METARQADGDHGVLGADMTAVEGIIGQIAHDFNNLLTPLLAYPELIKMDLADDSPSRDLIGAIEETTANMVYITQQLLALAPRRHGEKEQVAVDFVIRNVISWLEGDILPACADLDVSVPEEQLLVIGMGDDVMKAVQCLCSNALESVQERSLRQPDPNRKLRVSLKCDLSEDAGHETRCGLVMPAGRYVRITVEDEGTGISDDNIPSIFVPFFTTKRGDKKKRGSGLGLNIVYRIARDYAGGVDFETSEAGSVFRLYLPSV